MRAARRTLTLVVVAALASTPAWGPAWAQWSTEVVAGFGNHADLAVDASGNPHVLYNNCVAWEVCLSNGPRELTYAVRSGGGWSYEAVAGDPKGFLTSIVVDDTGQPHIAYCDSTGQMHYGYRGGGAWPLENLDHPGTSLRLSPSLTLDGTGEPHIAFIESENAQYQRRVGGLWVDERVTNSWLDNWSARAAIAVDGQDSVRVGTWEYYNSAVLYTRAGAAWDSDHVGGEIGWNPWMVLDGNDDAHFTYHSNAGVFYATDAGGGWTEELIDADASNEPNDIALDSTGRPLVVYTHLTIVAYYPPEMKYNLEVRVAVRQPSGWQSQLVAKIDTTTWDDRTDPRIEVDAFDNVHVLYRNPKTGALHYGTRAIPLPVGSHPPAVTRPFITHIAPNPFNPAAEIAFRVESSGPVRLEVYDVTGRLVRTLLNTTLPHGDYLERWNGATGAGVEAPSGVYFFRLETSGGAHTRRAVLAK